MKKIFVFAVFAFVSAIACANPWSYHGPKRDIVTLVVTANYEKPRLIAELIQVESRQPFLLLPTNDNGNIYFCPPTHLGSPKFVGRKKLGNVIAFIAPKQIIVLGNEKYVSEAYVKELRKIAPVCVISAETWQQAADTVAPMLNLSRLPKSFRKLSAELESGRLYIPKKKEQSEAAEEDTLLTVNASEKDPAVSDEPQIAAPAGNSEKAPAVKKESKDPAEYPAFDAAPGKAEENKAEPVKTEVAPLA